MEERDRLADLIATRELRCQFEFEPAEDAMNDRPQQRIYRTWSLDGSRWQGYHPRSGDIIIATYPKCGTTWMQRIVGLLVFKSDAPFAIPQVSPWVDRRFMEAPEAMHARIETQTHRRFLKTHQPLDGLPYYEDVSYIHVARDGRDVAASYHNHMSGIPPSLWAEFDRNGMDDPSIGRPAPRTPATLREFFHRWLVEEACAGEQDGLPGLSFFKLVDSFWRERHAKNVLLVHYDDLKTDLAGEMRRIADFLQIDVPSTTWPRLVEAASFSAMKREGAALMPQLAHGIEGGADRFFYKASSGRWKGEVDDADLALYSEKLATRLTPSCANWLEQGRRIAGDPTSAVD